jgi:hypothetical protein
MKRTTSKNDSFSLFKGFSLTGIWQLPLSVMDGRRIV